MNIEGQMWPKEREFLYSAVLARRPHLALEIGTWKGGGSTYQIASAMRQAQIGKLYTCETDVELYNSAVDSYKDSELRKHIEFNNIDSTTLIHKLLNSNMIPDFVFFDGPENPDLNLSDFILLEPHMRPGNLFCMHDWDTDLRPDGFISVKAQKLRPYIENSNKWKILMSLTAPISVGIVLAEKL